MRKQTAEELPFYSLADRDKIQSWKPKKSERRTGKVHARKDFHIQSEDVFNSLLAIERKRTERTGDPFVLMLLDFTLLIKELGVRNIERIGKEVSCGIRDNDIVGWYRYPDKIAILFTALGNVVRSQVEKVLREKAMERLQDLLPPNDYKRVAISFHFFPEEMDTMTQSLKGDEVLYPDLNDTGSSRISYRILKRGIDIVGSIVGLILFSPLFLLIPLLIKFSSKGPVFFRQKRLGRFGKEFIFIKFRTMYTDNNPEIHRQYVKSLIERKEQSAAVDKDGKPVFKIVNDPRIIPCGHFLRKTSLDELPQFLNVLKGDMSLVGPRPPIPYEVAEYDTWHRRRILEVQPGVTGIWQVYGRSRTTFDEMVRLDLQYIREQSLWLDIKLLLKTPIAVLFGSGAY